MTAKLNGEMAKIRGLPIYFAFGNFFEVIHKILASAREDLQVDVTKDARLLARIEDRLQQAIEIIEDSTAVEAGDG